MSSSTGTVGADTIFGFAGAEALIGNVEHDFLDAGVGDDTVTSATTLVPGADGQSGVSAVLPTFVAIQVGGSSTPQATSGAVTELTTTVQALDPTGSQQVSAINDFINSRPVGTTLDVRTLTPTVSSGLAPSIPIVVTGVDAEGGTQEAFVINMTAAPRGTTVQLDNIEFASIIGQATIIGGSGENYVVADDNAQFISLGVDDDTILGGGGADTVASADGDDILYGNQGADLVSGGANNDTLYGGKDSDILFGNTDADLLYGNQAVDTMYGGQGADVLFGGQAGDLLFGGIGNDTLIGGRGADVLSGGSGSDSFLFNVSSGADRISDFSIAEGDRIQFAIDGSGVGAVSQLAASLASDAAGDVILNLGEGVSVTLTGVTSGSASGIIVDLTSGGVTIESNTLGGLVSLSQSSALAAPDPDPVADTRSERLEDEQSALYYPPGEWL